MDNDWGDELSLEELWRLVRPALLPAFILAALAGAAAFWLTRQQVPIYEATARVLVVEPRSTPGFSTPIYQVPPLDPEAYREIARSNPVLAEAFPEDVDPAVEQKRLKVRVIKGRNSSILTLSVRDPDPKRAAAHANRWAEALVAWEDRRAKEQFRRDEAAIQARIAVIDRQLAQAGEAEGRREGLLRLRADAMRDLDLVRAMELSAQGNLTVLERARPPEEPVAPRPLLAGVLAGFLGFFLVVFGVFLRQALDPRLRSSEEAARITALPVLGEFPRVPPGAGRKLSKEAANYLRTGLDQALGGVSPKVVVVTSAEEGAGKSSVALALARAFARTGRPVLLIDADLRQPVLDEELGTVAEEGLVAQLTDRSRPFEPHRVQPFLDFLPAGGTPENPSELLTEHWRDFLAQLVELGRYEVIVVDSAPLLPVADTLVIVPHASGTLLVAAEGKTNKRHLAAALELLRRVGAKVLGLALTRVREAAWFTGGYRGYARYGYGYGRPRPRSEAALEEKPPA